MAFRLDDVKERLGDAYDGLKEHLAEIEKNLKDARKAGDSSGEIKALTEARDAYKSEVDDAKSKVSSLEKDLEAAKAGAGDPTRAEADALAKAKELEATNTSLGTELESLKGSTAAYMLEVGLGDQAMEKGLRKRSYLKQFKDGAGFRHVSEDDDGHLVGVDEAIVKWREEEPVLFGDAAPARADTGDSGSDDGDKKPGDGQFGVDALVRQKLGLSVVK